MLRTERFGQFLVTMYYKHQDLADEIKQAPQTGFISDLQGYHEVHLKVFTR